MAAYYGSSDKSRWSIWPSDVEPYYRPAVFVALGASVGVIVGTLAPWADVLVFTVNGLDVANWGPAALVLGAVSAFALLTVMFWGCTPFDLG
jgi:hypothetical protein